MSNITAKQQKAYTQAVERIRSLLDTWLASGVELFCELRKVDKSGVWRNGQHATFADFLSREFHDVLGLNRYENVVKAMDLYGIDRVKTHGIEVCHALISPKVTRDPDLVRTVAASLDQHVAVNHTPVTPSEAKKIVAGVAQQTAPLAASTRSVFRRSAEQQEIARLKSELQSANKRIRELERELDRTRAALAKATGSNGKPLAKTRRNVQAAAVNH